MRSIKSYIYQWAFRCYSRITSGSDKALSKYIKKTLNFLPPKQVYKKFNVVQIEVNGFPCFVIQPKHSPLNNKKVIYLHGGGYIQQITSFHWRFVGRTIDKTGYTFYVPIYPLCTPEVHPVHDNLALITKCYQEILKTNKPSDVIFMGDSAGACLAIVMGIHFNELKLPQPHHIVAISPVVDMTPTCDECMRMAKTDPILTFALLWSAIKWYGGQDDLKAYYFSPMYADLTDLPQITITIGTKECSYSQIKAFVGKLQSNNNKVNFLIGRDLFHVFPLFLFREGKKFHNEICKIITTS